MHSEATWDIEPGHGDLPPDMTSEAERQQYEADFHLHTGNLPAYLAVTRQYMRAAHGEIARRAPSVKKWEGERQGLRNAAIARILTAHPALSKTAAEKYTREDEAYAAFVAMLDKATYELANWTRRYDMALADYQYGIALLKAQPSMEK